MKHRKTSWLTVRVEFVNSPRFSLTPSSPQRFDAKWQTQPAFYPSPAGGTLSPDISSCPASCLSETSLHFLKITAQISTAAITSSLSPHQIPLTSAVNEPQAQCCQCQGPLLNAFIFCLTSTYLLTFAWKASIGLWRSIVLVFSSERSSARSAGCVCAEKWTGIK